LIPRLLAAVGSYDFGVIDDANALLSEHPLAAIRLLAWDPSRRLATFEVFHIEWPRTVYGVLRFGDVAYLQCATEMQWGYAIRLSPATMLSSRGDADSSELVFEFFARDGAEPSSFVVAKTVDCERPLDRGPHR
jgi:hypothetical protein